MTALWYSQDVKLGYGVKAELRKVEISELEIRKFKKDTVSETFGEITFEV